MQRATLKPHEQRESARPVAEIDASAKAPGHAAGGSAEGRGRRLSLAAHTPAELAFGGAAVVLPLLLGLGWTAFLLSAAVGVLMIGAGLASTDGAGARGRIGVRAHAVADRLLMVALASSALGFALAGRTDQTVYFGAFTIAFAALVLLTRYSRP